MRRALPAVVAVIAASVALSPLASPTSAAAAPVAKQAAAKKLVKTPYVMGATAHGTKVRGSAIPAGSSETGYEVMGCNRYANKAKSNYIAEIAVPGLGTIDGVQTKVWTVKKGNKVSSISRHTIAAITLAESNFGALEITGIESRSEAFHDAKGFDATVENNIARLQYTPSGGGEPQVLAIPAPGAPIVIPGLLKIAVGKSATKKGSDFAEAKGTVLRIKVLPTGTTVVIGSTKASMALASTRGLFNGFGAGLQARALRGAAQVGRTGYQPIPCTGTDNKDVVKDVADADLSPLAVAGVVAGGVNAGRTKRGAKAKAAGVVTDISLGDDSLQVAVVRGVANVRRSKNGKLFANTLGTHIGEITAGGESYDLDELGQLTIPGVAELQSNVVTKSRNGLKVIGLRVVLLGEDNDVVIVDLGVAEAKIRPTKKAS